MDVLVTGGAGFIGSHLCEQLLIEGYKVHILDNFSTGKEENIQYLHSIIKKNKIPKNNFKVIRGDIRDKADIKLAIRGIDLVFHEAADPSVQKSIESPLEYHEINCVGTLNVLAAARENQVKKIIFASSCAVYGDDPHLPKSELRSITNPISPYGADKLCSEYYCQLFFKLYGLETVVLRYFNVFGPRQDPSSHYSGVISIFLEHYKKNKIPAIYGDGEQCRDFIYVKDIVRANILACNGSNIGGQIFNVARGQKITLNNLISILNKITGKNILPYYEGPRKGDIRESVADVLHIRNFLNFLAGYTLENALRDTYDYNP